MTKALYCWTQRQKEKNDIRQQVKSTSYKIDTECIRDKRTGVCVGGGREGKEKKIGENKN